MKDVVVWTFALVRKLDSALENNFANKWILLLAIFDAHVFTVFVAVFILIL